VAAQGGALAPPIVQTSLFAYESLDDLMAGLANEDRRHVYTRGQNPTVEAVEHKLARLERGEVCKAFASGMAAVSAVLLGLLKAGDHILFVNQTYGPTLQLARHLRRFGLEHDLLLELDLGSVRAAVKQNTRLIWLESPGTMLFRVLDVAGVAELARAGGIITAMDNSWATPLFQKPLTEGVDLVVHSATKYLAGHSDLVAGALVGSADLMKRIFYNAFLLQGGILAPFDAWLLNRGMRTLPVRMRRHHENGLAVARFLESHSAVRRVFYPGIEPGEDSPLVASLTGFSGLMSLELASEGYESVRRFVDGLRRFRIGVSWGGVESLVITPNNGHNHTAREALGIPAGTVRLSIGHESPEVLIEDLEGALAGI
jgi:cystathionine beta-lyase/cystathionine gamma-synthase